jgi:hypothetical protein
MPTVELIMTPFLISGGDAHLPLDSAKMILKFEMGVYNEHPASS